MSTVRVKKYWFVVVLYTSKVLNLSNGEAPSKLMVIGPPEYVVVKGDVKVLVPRSSSTGASEVVIVVTFLPSGKT